ncbi:hypothetical protein L3073_04035 [Ancylomarina sp. DW003]|nr:hypothetical protein [Ancylomarina sp. DW003]MDE5421368.1 hypothetical protein [Ancylomarina sp. DW003]
MNATNFELKFNARRPFAATKRKGYYVLGLIEMLVGSVGVFMIEYPLSRFYMILFIGGVFSFLAAAYGKNLIREANTIIINPQNIVFKNVSQRAKKLEVEDLYDIVLEKDRVEFITKERRYQTYDFSIYTESERKDLCKVLNQLKENLS